MKHISKYNNYFIINEDKSNDKQIILDALQDIIDDYKTTFSGDVYVMGDVISGKEIYSPENYKKFTPIFTSGNSIKSLFTFSVKNNGDSGLNGYEDFVQVMSDMIVPIERLKEIGWNLSRFEVMNNTTTINMSAKYTFDRPSIKIEGKDKIYLGEVASYLENEGFIIWSDKINDISEESDVYKYELYFRLGNSTILNDIEIDDFFRSMCDEFGFNTYDSDIQGTRITLSFYGNTKIVRDI